MAPAVNTMVVVPPVITNTLLVPVEVFVMIMSLLTFEDLFNARLVCTEWRSWILSDSSLRRLLFLPSFSGVLLPSTLYRDPFRTNWAKFITLSSRYGFSGIHPLIVNNLSATDFHQLSVTLRLPGPLSWLCPIPDLQPILNLYRNSYHLMYASQPPVAKAFLVIRMQPIEAQYTLIENQTGVTLYDVARAIYDSIMRNRDANRKRLDKIAYSKAFSGKESFGVFLIEAGSDVRNLIAYHQAMNKKGVLHELTP